MRLLKLLLMSCLACACGELPLLELPLQDTVWGSSALWDQLYLGDVYRNFDSLRSRNRSLATDGYRLNDTGRRYRAASLVCDVDDMRMDVSMLLQLCDGTSDSTDSAPAHTARFHTLTSCRKQHMR